MKPSIQGRYKSQLGLSLVEMMVGLAVGMLVVVAVLALIVRMSMSRSEVDRAGRQIESGRYAIHKLAEDLRHAGYFGEFSDLACRLSLRWRSTPAPPAPRTCRR
jgi:type IV pilus assembly protein PilW